MFFGYSRGKCLHFTNFNFPFRPSLFFFKKRLRYQIQEQAITTFAERRFLGKSFCAIFFSENLRVVEVNLYGNFLSSRKYDWNVAPKDLEKIRRAHGACVVFFKKK